MYFSKYNIIEKFEQNTIIYNALSSAILKLNEEYSEEFFEFLENGVCTKKDLKNSLVQAGMVYESPINELNLIKFNNNKSRYEKKILSYTIAPTMQCNFKCDYCFEDGKRYNTMNDETVRDTINFIVKNSINSEQVNISWYGGEPLIAIKQIKEISQGIKTKINKNIKYTANIVTNGYLLSRKNANILKDLDIKKVQITLDGAKESHDKRRILLNGEGTFNKILDNIKDCYDLLDINIRVNLDKRNSNQYMEILNELEKANLKNKVNIYIAAVDNMNEQVQCTTCLNECEFADKQNHFLKELKNRNFKISNKIVTRMGICGAVSDNSILIDPLGDLYNCWNDISEKEKSVGNIQHGIFINNQYLSWMNYDPLKNIKCTECNLLPICMGGCPHSIKNNKNKCIPKKYNLRKFLEYICF